MMEAVLSNADHPEYGVATIPLPIPRNQYDHCVALLEALEIGDASEADCRLDSLDSALPVLNRLVCTKVNLDELDYLAKRLDSFTVGEFSQFQAMAEKLNLTSMKDLINLTFCCQQATVITDFTNLKEVGRDHYMNIHGGCASMEELEQLDGVETAVLLIEDNEGTITRYGVVYDNGMQLSQLFDGKHLPCYHYEADMTAVGISSRWEPENSRNVTWIYLPASKGQIERAVQRSGIADPKDMRLFILVAGLMVFSENALLGLGLMLSAGEVPRIAGTFGLDTTTRANIMSAVYTAQAAVNTTRTLVQAATK